MRWPIRDGLLAYLARVRAELREQYYVNLLVWASIAPNEKNPRKPPRLPPLLAGS